ncbi:MAG: 1-acyl-sn-glycerol-3-phosphate acyltransferase [Oscillospiraceae bacterium]|nr:1-acyl-sn-glycerol-3-phosphate acyltransferase [Oscillospiraceae bacterium]
MVYVITVAVVTVIAHLLFKFEYYGKDIINQYKTNGRPYIVCPNHVSAIDPVFVVVARGSGRKLTVMAKEELFKIGILSWFFRKLGAIPVARGTGDKDVLEKAINDVKNGAGALIFPEGTRGNGNEMGKLKSGAFAIAAQTGADIIPVRIIYHTKDGNMKLFCKVTTVFGEPLKIEDTQLDTGSRQQIRVAKAMLEESYAKMLEEYK